MARYFIEAVKNGIADGGMACGPVAGPVICEAKVKTDDGNESFFCLAEVDGIPNFFKTEHSTFDQQMGYMTDEEVDYLNDHYLDVAADYDEIFEDPESELYDLCRYLIYMVRCVKGEEDRFAKETIGKYIDEIDIPASDLEEKYLEEFEEEEKSN